MGRNDLREIKERGKKKKKKQNKQMVVALDAEMKTSEGFSK